jgi:peptidoglycan-associated lipoprotein
MRDSLRRRKSLHQGHSNMIFALSNMLGSRLDAKYVAMVLLVVGLQACASNPQQSDAGLGGAVGRAAPGSIAEFAQAAGDRVFFESDSSELTGSATATLDKQALWLARYPLPDHCRGPCRRARHP